MSSNYYKYGSFTRFVFKAIGVFTFLIDFTVAAQTETSNLCKQIYGKWETYYIELPFAMEPPNKNEIWVFSEDGTVTINGKKSTFKLEEECSILFIDSNKRSFSMLLLKDTLVLKKRIMVHESYILRFKKLVKND